MDTAKRRSIAAAVLLLAAAAGCRHGPPPRYYTLVSTAPAEGALVQRPDLGIAVGPIEFPRYLERPEIVTRDGAQALVLANEHRWGGSLRDDLLRVVADDLGVLLGTDRVEIYPNEPRFPVSYRVLLDLRQFEGPLGGEVTLRMRWSILGADGKALAVRESAIRKPAASPSFDDQVAAQGAALGAASREIAEEIAQLATRKKR
jgi:hypothetical protein